jgi:DNA processing protein
VSNTDEYGLEPVLYWIWLAETLGFANTHAKAVIETFGSARKAWEHCTTEEFHRVAGNGAAARVWAEGNSPTRYRMRVAECRAKGIRILTYEEPEYPNALRQINDLPPVLYCRGDVRWLNEKTPIGMVGSRHPSTYSRLLAIDFGRELARGGAIIVSGMARGLDSQSHYAALQENRPTIAVQGVPIDRIYPIENTELRSKIEACGCVISEYAPGESNIGKAGFVLRNRLIAALSDGLLVLGAREQSGTMSTVAYAEKYGKPVFAIPANVYLEDCKGSNGLLESNRAKYVRQACSIWETLNLQNLGLNVTELHEDELASEQTLEQLQKEEQAQAKKSAAKRKAKPKPEAVEEKPKAEPKTKAAEEKPESKPKPKPETRISAPLSDAERSVLAYITDTPQGIEALAIQSGLPTPKLLVTLMSLELKKCVKVLPGKQYILA